jgi:hypothetical protein
MHQGHGRAFTTFEQFEPQHARLDMATPLLSTRRHGQAPLEVLQPPLQIGMKARRRAHHLKA